MSNDISFEEDEFIVPSNFYQNKISFMIKLVIKVGLAKDESQANFVLLLSAIIFVCLTVATVYIFLIPEKPVERSYESLSEIEKLRLPEEIRNAYENKR